MNPQQKLLWTAMETPKHASWYLIIEQDFNLFGVKMAGGGCDGADVTTIVSQNFM